MSTVQNVTNILIRIIPVKICLPQDSNELYDDSAAIVTGWGTTDYGGELSSILLEVTLEVGFEAITSWASVSRSCERPRSYQW